MRNYKKWTLILLAFWLAGGVVAGGIWWNKNRPSSNTKNNLQVSENGEPRLVVQLGHSGGISSAVYSPDGKFIVSGGIDDKVAILWEASTGREIRRFIGHTNQINSVAFSPDSKFVLTGSGGEYLEEKDEKDFTARLWNISNGNEIRKFEGHTDKINSVTFSPDGKNILTGSNDKTARLWNLVTGQEIKKVGEHKASVNSAKFSPNGKYIATGNGDIDLFVNVECKDCVAKLFDASSMKLIYQFTEHNAPIGSVAFSPDNKFVLTANFTPESDIHLPNDDNGNYKPTNGVYQWNVETGKKIHSYKGFGPAEFSFDSSLVITSGGGSKGDGMQIWDANTGESKNNIGKFSQYQAKESASGPDNIWLANEKIFGVGQITSFSPNNLSMLIGFDSIKGSGNLVFEWGEKSLYIFDINSGQKKTSLNGDIQKYSNTELATGTNPITETNRFIQIGSNVWDKVNGKQVLLEGTNRETIFTNPQILSKDGSIIISGIYDKKFKNPFSINVWETQTGNKADKFREGYGSWITPNNKYVLIESLDTDNIEFPNNTFLLSFYEIKTGNLKWSFPLNISMGGPNSRYLNQDRTYSKLSDDGRFVYALLPEQYQVEITGEIKPFSENELLVIESESGRIIKRITTPKQTGSQGLEISPNGNFAAFGSDSSGASIVDIKSGISGQIGNGYCFPRKFSPDNKFIAISCNLQDYDLNIQIWNLETRKLVNELPKTSFGLADIDFSASGSKLLISKDKENTAQLFDFLTGKEIFKFEHYGIITSSKFSKDGHLAITSSDDGTSRIWSIETGKEICKLTSFANGDWIVTTPDGRFDTNNLDKVEGMHWIMASEPLRPLPIEIFMRQYYEPKLLARVLRCNEEKNCEQEFKPLPALNTLNRTQPSVKITEVKPDSEGTVEVTVEVANSKSEGQKDTFGNPLESGVNDVRLLRDGQLVGYAPKTSNAAQSTWEWFKSFVVKSSESTNGKVELTQDGKATLKFSKIKLPKTGIDKVEFSAYAFNVDQIKSETSRQIYEYKASNVKGRAYIISMGVNSNEKQGSDLRFAANDARQTQEILAKRLLEQGQYEEVVNIPLVSDFTVAVNGNSVSAKDATVGQIKTGQKTVTENTATKAHFKAVLDILAGRKGDAELLKSIKNSDKLRQTNPEDLIILSVSSHGSADKNGIFYLLASDGNTISSDELSLWLRDVDGGELTMVIDACHAASAVETADFKPAPMNSRGLGQLSYDKGMRILTATQADNVALETNKTRQGLLSYALLQNGLNDFQADFKPQDRTIVMSEWLNFGVMRVPKLWDEAQSGQVKVVRETNDIVEAETQQKQEKTQQPSLFDFSRKGRDVTLEKRGGNVPTPMVDAPKIVTPVSTPTPSSSPTINTQNFNGRVIKSDCRIREYPTLDSTNVIGKLNYNDPINIGEQRGRWFFVTTATGLKGWMDGDLIEYNKQ